MILKSVPSSSFNLVPEFLDVFCFLQHVLVVFDILDELSLLLSQVAHRLILYLKRFGLGDGGVDVSHDLVHLVDLGFAVLEVLAQLLYGVRWHSSEKQALKIQTNPASSRKMRLRAVY